MIKFNKRKAKTNYFIFSVFSNWFKYIGYRIANCLSKQEKKLSAGQRKILFFSLFGFLATIAICLTLNSFLNFGKENKKSKNVSFGGSISPVFLINSSKESDHADMEVEQLRLFIKFMDSLKSADDHSAYDSLVKESPGLVDSLEYIKRYLTLAY